MALFRQQVTVAMSPLNEPQASTPAMASAICQSRAWKPTAVLVALTDCALFIFVANFFTSQGDRPSTSIGASYVRGDARGKKRKRRLQSVALRRVVRGHCPFANALSHRFFGLLKRTACLSKRDGSKG